MIYQRPIGTYLDREGKKYNVTKVDYEVDEMLCDMLFARYLEKVNTYGWAEEHARDLLPMSMRQHFVMSVNIRSLMHILDLRAKADAQLEIQTLSEMLMSHFTYYAPEIADWYKKSRYKKARLAP